MKGEMPLSLHRELRVKFKWNTQVWKYGCMEYVASIGIPDAACINVSFQKTVLKLTSHYYSACLVRLPIPQH